MEEQELLNKSIGTKENIKLKPEKVKIVKVEVVKVGDKGSTKVVCNIKHSAKEELVKVSEVKFESKGKLDIVGLWGNLDEDKQIRKGSALAVLMSFLNCKTPKEMEGKEIQTVEDELGYLCFKAY